MFWEFPANRYLLKRLTSFARVIVFDKRGQGLSDRVGEQTLEERVADVRAVMDAAQSEKATIFGWSEGGTMSLMFCAAYPQRVLGLVLCGSFASAKAEPWGVDHDRWTRYLQRVEAHWGEGVLVPINAPSRVNDQPFLQWFARLERAAASPGARGGPRVDDGQGPRGGLRCPVRRPRDARTEGRAGGVAVVRRDLGLEPRSRGK
jgi:pimeloyl-ACP methyl ester carboxylesterase